MGIGTAQIDTADQCEQYVQRAIAAGYRLIDTAAAYQNEEAVGRAIKASGIQRNELFLTTKLWIQDSGYKETKQAFDRSKKRLGVDYIDLYLIHQPIGDIYGSWRAMEELYEAGEIKAIGVSNFSSDRLADLMLFHKVKPAINQIEVHPYCQANEIHQYMQAVNVQTEAWGVFAGGKSCLLKNDELVRLGKKYKKTAAQVILRWMLQRRIVSVFKAVSMEHLKKNIDILDFELTDKELLQMMHFDTRQSIFINYNLPETVQRLGMTRFAI